MPRNEKIWHLLPVDPIATQRLVSQANVSPVVAQLLVNREILDPVAARRFIDSPLSGLHPPIDLPGVADAATRLAKAVIEKQRICVYGDYDVDGVTGTAILLALLNELGADVEFHTPCDSPRATVLMRRRCVSYHNPCLAGRERRLWHRVLPKQTLRA